jgi:hypothetical protein
VADTYKVLGQSNPLATTLTDLYIVPGATQVISSTVTVCNRSATPTSFRLSVAPAGAVDALEHYFAYDTPIGANVTIAFTIGITLAATDVVRVFATLATLSFQVFGVERT